PRPRRSPASRSRRPSPTGAGIAPRSQGARLTPLDTFTMVEHDARRRAAWRFVLAVIRSQKSGVIGAALSGLLWQVGAVSALLMVKYAIDHGVLTRDRHTLYIWLAALL